MVLNDEQNEVFFDTMDALLYYVNDRFRVVEGFTLNYTSALDDVKSSLVAHALWENVQIIDDFVSDNPFRLPQRCLDIALSWKSALPGMFTLVRYQSGRALLMNEAGVFSVCGVTYELEQEIGPAPAYVETVLLPFEDLIVYDGFLQAYDTERSASDVQRIQDEFENRCAKGIALTAAEFMRSADAYLAEQRDREFEELLADMSREADGVDETLPEGFHRGALAGLPPEERRRIVLEHVREASLPHLTNRREFDRRVRRGDPTTSLRECLMRLTKVELESIADVLGMGGISRLRKSEMADELVAELPAGFPAFESRLLFADNTTYRRAKQLAADRQIAFGADELEQHAFDWPMEPYEFMFRTPEGYVLVVPDEVASLYDAADFEALDRMRRQHSQALACADACAMICGVASVDDVYDQYRALVADVVSRDDFDLLLESEAMLGIAAFDLWSYPPTDYIVHYTLGADYVAQEFARYQQGSFGTLMRNAETGELDRQPFQQMLDRARTSLASELEWLEQYKRELVESQANLPMKPLSRTLLENDLMDELLDDPNAVRLRTYLDERVPDGEDDYTFADRITEDVVLSSIESGNLQDILGALMERGLHKSSHDEGRLTLLVTNVFNAMPSWENNGWSPQELYEQVTGRKMFYNDDGTIMRVGADEPCPCGSGKKYRDCCGR